MNSFLAFLGVSLIVIVTPGPDTAVTIRNTLIGGRSGGVSTALGIAGGQAIWAFATSIGIVTLLVASAPLFLAVKYAGAAYLAYLGVQALRDAIRPAASAGKEMSVRVAKSPAWRRSPHFDRASSAISATRRWLSSSRASCRSSYPRAKKPSQRSCALAPCSQ